MGGPNSGICSRRRERKRNRHTQTHTHAHIRTHTHAHTHVLLFVKHLCWRCVCLRACVRERDRDTLTVCRRMQTHTHTHTLKHTHIHTHTHRTLTTHDAKIFYISLSLSPSLGLFFTYQCVKTTPVYGVCISVTVTLWAYPRVQTHTNVD